MDESPNAVLLLGPTDLRIDGASAVIGGTKVRAVLAQLALADGRVVTADQLIDGVWGEQPPATATNTLQYHVTVLRKALAKAGLDGALTTRPPGYALAVPTDVRAFHDSRQRADAAARDGRPEDAAAAYAQALATWRGPALADLLGFPFAGPPAVALEESRLYCVESWIDESMRLGQADGLIPELEQLVSEHPTRERFWQQLMVALYRSGRQADALAAYDRARRMLDDELGIEPSPALRQTHAQVLSQASVLAGSRVRATIPAAATRLRSSLPTQKAWLVHGDGQRTTLASGRIIIGRDAACDIVLTDDDQISRRHAAVHPTGDGHALEDLVSTNGTYLNGARITHITRLAHGDRVELGATVLRYDIADPG